MHKIVFWFVFRELKNFKQHKEYSYTFWNVSYSYKIQYI